MLDARTRFSRTQPIGIKRETRPLAHPRYRADIDGLRAIAVLSIIGFHAFPHAVRGGFIGVDIFFVISGFLISSILFDGLGRHEFRFAQFYSRRITRIFPALILVLAACIGIGWFALMPQEFEQLGKQAAAGATPAINFVFWSESGYFDALSIAKPLIHLWSLGIEEQFYLAWPAILWVCARKKFNFLAITLGIAAFSFGLNVVLTRISPLNAFYSPFPRFWEFLVGALVAYAVLHQRNPVDALSPLARNALSLIAAAGIVAGLLLQPGAAAFPGVRVLAHTVGTAILIAAGERTWLNRAVLASPPLVWFGLISYPLYLWHWPLLSFAWIGTGDIPAPEIRAACVIMAIALAWLTYRFVETPIRNARASATPLLLAGGLMAIGCAGLFIYFENGIRGRMADIVAYNAVPEDRTLSTPACIAQYHDLWDGGVIKTRDFCLGYENGRRPDVFLVGDSHAVQLHKGFRSLGLHNTTILGRGSCPPIFDAPDIGWLQCRTEDRMIDFALRSDAKLLILTGTFERYFNGGYGGIPAQKLEQDVRDTFEKLGRARKHVLVVLDNPSLPFRSAACFKRPIPLTVPRDCSFDRKFHENGATAYKALFRKYAGQFENIRLLDAAESFCDAQKCRARNEQGMLYVGDNNRLNMRGAAIVDRKIIGLYPDVFGR